MFEVIRFIFCSSFFLLTWRIIAKSQIRRKRRALLLCFAGMCMLQVVSTVCPVENAFLTFSSPEEAYRYRYLNGGEIDFVLEGEETAMVVAGGSTEIVVKSGTGWKLSEFFQCRKPAFFPVGSGTAVVEQYGDVKDFYLWISHTGSKPPEVKDNRKTEFQYTSQKVRVMRGLETTEHVCCGYVRDIDSSYALWVNGETVPFDLTGIR